LYVARFSFPLELHVFGERHHQRRFPVEPVATARSSCAKFGVWARAMGCRIFRTSNVSQILILTIGTAKHASHVAVVFRIDGTHVTISISSLSPPPCLLSRVTDCV
jgi:uncharacterized protein (UPF0548 family)